MSTTAKERQLPTGVDVGAELRAFGTLGCERELWDSRSDDANPRKRIGLFLCVGPRDGSALQRQLQQRADLLLGRSLPHVITSDRPLLVATRRDLFRQRADQQDP